MAAEGQSADPADVDDIGKIVSLKNALPSMKVVGISHLVELHPVVG